MTVASGTAAAAGVGVILGPTPIIEGSAKAAGDLTVANEKLAFALAVESPVPYGVPRGAIVDLAPVENGVIGRDRVVFADFIPNNWSAWPNTYQHIDILERGPERAVVRAVRDWGQATVATTYTLDADSDHIVIQTTLTNGGTTALPALSSGLTLWPNSGFLFAVPGSGAAPLADRVVAYDEHWTVALHASNFDHLGDGSMDLYRSHTLRPGASEVFEGWLQVGTRGDLAPIVRAEIERRHLASGTVHGVVLDADAKAVEQPVVVVESHGTPYAWVLGHDGTYDLTLPVGNYRVYATAKNYSQSAKSALNIVAGAAASRDFHDLQSPGSIHFDVTASPGDTPLDARIVITDGQKPLVQFLGRTTFFTELEPKGKADIAIAPGSYGFKITSGGGFSSESASIKLKVRPNEVSTAKVAVMPLFDPKAAGWYGADMHHHADQAEAVTPPADLARSQLAAGLDLLFVSDHDATVNHEPLLEIAAKRGVALIPAIELSPSWGHFNAYPLTPGQRLQIDTSVATIDEILKEARRQGAIVVQVNHPFIPYGYFSSVEAGVAPGGFDPAFDLVEINAAAPEDDMKVMHKLWEYWNSGHHYYLSAGTDTHDVWNSESGAIRMFAHLDGPAGAAAFARSLKAGHAYVSSGPLIFPDVMFGTERKVRPGEHFSLGFDLKSVAGLKKLDFIGAGVVLTSDAFANGPRAAHVDFPLTTDRPTWYALILEDVHGHKAYTNPIWVDAVTYR